MVTASSLNRPDSDSPPPLVDGSMLPKLASETFSISVGRQVRYIDETTVVGSRRMEPIAEMLVTPVHMDASDDAADIFTKTLCGRKLRCLRAKMLGHCNAEGSVDFLSKKYRDFAPTVTAVQTQGYEGGVGELW